MSLDNVISRSQAALSLLIPLVSMVWVLSLPQYLDWLVFSEQILSVLLGAAMGIVYLNDAAQNPSKWRRNIALLMAIVGVATGLYMAFRIPVLSEEAFFRPVETLLVALIAVPLVVEALRRSVGLSLVIVFGVFVLFALFGDLIPGKLQGRASSPTDLIRFLGTDSTAMLGLPLSVTCFVVVMFVLFGRMLQTTGGTALFTGISQALAGHGPASPAKVAIIASSLFGSVSGSAVSNVMSTGVVTIPMMKRGGMPAHRAGAVEAVASTGGQLMPPIMGAAAFLMAEFLQMPYKNVILAALIPAILYYLALFLQVDFLSRRDPLQQRSAEQSATPDSRLSTGAVLRRGWLLPVPFAVLLIGLFEFNLSPELAVLIALAVLIILSFGRRDNTQWMTPPRIIADLINTGRSVADLILVTAVAGMIIGILSNTGLSFSLGFVLLGFGNDSLLLLLLITAVVCIVLGMGLPTTGVYLLLATLAAPPLVELGLAPIQAHMFVLYFGMLSMITPPVALAAFAASSLSGAPQMRTGFEAMRLGWCAYVVPFLFIYHPTLLMQGGAGEILGDFLRVLLALLLISGGLAGYGLTRLSAATRIGAIGLSVLLLAPLPDAWNALAWLSGAIATLVIIGHVIQSRSTYSVTTQESKP